MVRRNGTNRPVCKVVKRQPDHQSLDDQETRRRELRLGQDRVEIQNRQVEQVPQAASSHRCTEYGCRRIRGPCTQQTDRKGGPGERSDGETVRRSVVVAPGRVSPPLFTRSWVIETPSSPERRQARIVNSMLSGAISPGILQRCRLRGDAASEFVVGQGRKGRGMGLFSGKKGLILGVANDFSIAWAIAQKLLDEGAELGFTHLPGDKMERRVRKLAEPIGARLITPCDVQNDDDVARVFDQAQETYGCARLRAPFDRVCPGRRPEVPVRERQPRGLQDGHGHQRLLAGDRGSPRGPRHARGAAPSSP